MESIRPSQHDAEERMEMIMERIHQDIMMENQMHIPPPVREMIHVIRFFFLQLNFPLFRARGIQL